MASRGECRSVTCRARRPTPSRRQWPRAVNVEALHAAVNRVRPPPMAQSRPRPVRPWWRRQPRSAATDGPEPTASSAAVVAPSTAFGRHRWPVRGRRAEVSASPRRATRSGAVAVRGRRAEVSASPRRATRSGAVAVRGRRAEVSASIRPSACNGSVVALNAAMNLKQGIRPSACNGSVVALNAAMNLKQGIRPSACNGSVVAGAQ